MGGGRWLIQSLFRGNGMLRGLWRGVGRVSPLGVSSLAYGFSFTVMFSFAVPLMNLCRFFGGFHGTPLHVPVFGFQEYPARCEDR